MDWNGHYMGKDSHYMDGDATNERRGDFYMEGHNSYVLWDIMDDTFDEDDFCNLTTIRAFLSNLSFYGNANNHAKPFSAQAKPIHGASFKIVGYALPTQSSSACHPLSMLTPSCKV
jgi:hypothetical protein